MSETSDLTATYQLIETTMRQHAATLEQAGEKVFAQYHRGETDYRASLQVTPAGGPIELVFRAYPTGHGSDTTLEVTIFDAPGYPAIQIGRAEVAPEHLVTFVALLATTGYERFDAILRASFA